MRCLILGLLLHGLARRSMDINATNWYQSFTHDLLARPEAAQRLTWWNAYAQPLATRPLVLAVFSFLRELYFYCVSSLYVFCNFCIQVTQNKKKNLR
jgi:hypothetical protein